MMLMALTQLHTLSHKTRQLRKINTFYGSEYETV